ncbi:uncharacterized protein [Montipora foliosa]|uniref:uncharacterized protein n=1 Tax=Montipora foliosa TaxID=591990 RepID=UPI0035F1197B
MTIVSVREVQDDDKELRKSSNVQLSVNMSQVDLLLQRLSSWPHLLRVMSWVLRFIKRCWRETHNAVPVMTPTLSELQSASREVVRVVQRECIHEEYVALKGGGKVKSNSKLANLSSILVNDVIRVGGRIHRAPIAFEAAHPVSTLIVRYYHHILGHSSREHVLSAVRQCYWILRARSLVRQVLNKCVSCRKRNALAMQQVKADLPAERLDVGSLETDAFIQALRRFISVHGSPKKIWSDNRTNFTGAEKELSRSIQDLDDGTIRRELHRYETDCCNDAEDDGRSDNDADDDESSDVDNVHDGDYDDDDDDEEEEEEEEDEGDEWIPFIFVREL